MARMTEAALLPVLRPETRIDFTRPFIAEDFTPLFHTPLYAALPPPIRLRYNQLHALYFNEQVAFFEQEMLSPGARRVAALPAPGGAGEQRADFPRRGAAAQRDVSGAQSPVRS